MRPRWRLPLAAPARHGRHVVTSRGSLGGAAAGVVLSTRPLPPHPPPPLPRLGCGWGESGGRPISDGRSQHLPTNSRRGRGRRAPTAAASRDLDTHCQAPGQIRCAGGGGGRRATRRPPRGCSHGRGRLQGARTSAGGAVWAAALGGGAGRRPPETHEAGEAACTKELASAPPSHWHPTALALVLGLSYIHRRLVQAFSVHRLDLWFSENRSVPLLFSTKAVLLVPQRAESPYFETVETSSMASCPSTYNALIRRR